MLSYSLNIVLGIHRDISQSKWLKWQHQYVLNIQRWWQTLILIRCTFDTWHYVKLTLNFNRHCICDRWRLISPQRPEACRHTPFSHSSTAGSAPVLLSYRTIPVRRQMMETHKTQESSSFHILCPSADTKVRRLANVMLISRNILKDNTENVLLFKQSRMW